ncbi:hypothetical protein PoB_004623800 [Plakobranchus ocellatus]|uniref:Uncharacterized protein n=1 Tax=Plakobranchus ocellatus TaxID=259542 RepID=A0AAV4BJG5_9GAST|nr:hypothetical protein PoB_004623800 [Plakobranchus ocellatus]
MDWTHNTRTLPPWVTTHLRLQIDTGIPINGLVVLRNGWRRVGQGRAGEVGQENTRRVGHKIRRQVTRFDTTVKEIDSTDCVWCAEKAPDVEGQSEGMSRKKQKEKVIVSRQLFRIANPRNIRWKLLQTEEEEEMEEEEEKEKEEEEKEEEEEMEEEEKNKLGK